MKDGQFDPTPHFIKLLVLRCGALLRKARGQDEETNISKLYLDTCMELGVEPIGTMTPTAQQRGDVPPPVDPIAKGKPIMARKCPKCEKPTFEVYGIRPFSPDGEGGKFHTLFECSQCGYVEKSARKMIDWVRTMTVGLPPARECPVCHSNSYYLQGVCGGCQDSENGKYKTKFECFECGHSEKSEKPMVKWFQEMGIDFGMQSKRSLGIRTVTDDGLK